MSSTPKTQGARLRLARTLAGYKTAAAFLAAHAVKQSTYSLHETGMRKFDAATAADYADMLDCSAGWLLTGEGAPPNDQLVGIIPSRSLAIPELDIRAAESRTSAGGILNGSAEVVDTWELPGEFVRAQTTAPTERLKVIRIYGDSMAPLLNAGDRVMVDMSDVTPTPPGLFVLWDGLGVVVKRLEYLPYSEPPAVRMLSHNPAYATYEKPLSDVHISGRVIGKWLWT